MDENVRKQKKEACNHELIKSEEFYVNELEAVITHIVQPLTKNADRCNIKKEDIKFVFGIMQHLFSFHVQIVRIIREEINIIPKFNQYFGFIEMYAEYMHNFKNILERMSIWTQSIQFREFVTLRLQNENVKQHIDERLCSLPWYLYRPFERIKQYYRFLKDLLAITLDTDDEYKTLLSMKTRLKPLYSKIKRRDLSFIKKTRLLEIQLQIFGNPELLVNDERYFVYTRVCQIKLNHGLGKRFKHINLYIFNDMILWVSKRGHWKKTIKFKDPIVYGKATKNNKSNDPLLFIGSGSVNGKSIKNPTQILMPNEQVRDECLERIRKVHERYQHKLQQRLQVKQPTLHPPELSATNSLTLDESFFDDGSQSLMPEAYHLRPLSSHHKSHSFNEDMTSSGDEDEDEDEHLSSTFCSSKSSPYHSMSGSGSGSSSDLSSHKNQNINYSSNNNNNNYNNYNSVNSGSYSVGSGSDISIAISMVENVQSMDTIPESSQNK